MKPSDSPNRFEDQWRIDATAQVFIRQREICCKALEEHQHSRTFFRIEPHRIALHHGALTYRLDIALIIYRERYSVTGEYEQLPLSTGACRLKMTGISIATLHMACLASPDWTQGSLLLSYPSTCTKTRQARRLSRLQALLAAPI